MRNRLGSQYIRNESQTQVFGNIKNTSKAGISFLARFLPMENAFAMVNSNEQGMRKPLKLGQRLSPPLPFSPFLPIPSCRSKRGEEHTAL